MWRNLAKAVRELGRGFGEGGRSYRPDLHYMRGPGPKWHAKYGNLAPKTPPAAPRDPALREAPNITPEPVAARSRQAFETGAAREHPGVIGQLLFQAFML